MIKNVKLHTALFICAVFAFRIVFFNIFAVSSYHIQQTNNILKAHFSTIMKRRVHAEAAEISDIGEYSFKRITEAEAPHKDEQPELNSFFLIKIIHSFLTRDLSNKLAAFYNHLSVTSSHRYLTFQVFRT